MKPTILKYNDLHLNLGRNVIYDFLKNIRFKNVLDIGAGNGDDLLIAKKINPKAKLRAIELNPSAIESLKKNNIEYFSLNIEKDPISFEDNSLDLIIANE